jgi:hypothetical protein
MARRQRANSRELAQSLSCLDLAALRVADDLVESGRCDPGRRAPASCGIDSIDAQPARRNAMISAVGGTTMRAPPPPLAAAIAMDDCSNPRSGSESLACLPADKRVHGHHSARLVPIARVSVS